MIIKGKFTPEDVMAEVNPDKQILSHSTGDCKYHVRWRFRQSTLGLEGTGVKDFTTGSEYGGNPRKTTG